MAATCAATGASSAFSKLLGRIRKGLSTNTSFVRPWTVLQSSPLSSWARKPARVAGLLQGEGSQPHVPSPTQLQRRNITLLTSFNVVDNSQLGQRAKRYRKPYLIGFYRKRKTAEIGDVIRVAVGGKTNKAIVVGTRRTKHHTVPRFDNNNIVLVDDNLAPLGTRIKGPVPTIIKRRQRKYSKVLATASRFI